MIAVDIAVKMSQLPDLMEVGSERVSAPSEQ